MLTFTSSAVFVALEAILYALAAWRMRPRSQENSRQRRYGSYLLFGLVAWSLSLVLGDSFWGEPSKARLLLAYGLRLAGYITFFGTIHLRPDCQEEPAPPDLVDRLDTVGAMVFGFTLLGYFVLAPSLIQGAASWDAFPISFLYLAFDLLVLHRYTVASYQTRSASWRLFYRAMQLAALCWFLRNLLESFQTLVFAQFGSWSREVILALALIAPALLWMAGRWRLGESSTGQRSGAPIYTLGPLIMVTLLLPTLHLTLSVLGEMDPRLRTSRDLIVVGYFLFLGSLTIIRERFLSARQTRLMDARQVAEGELRHRERQHRGLLEALREAVFVVREGRVEYRNAAADRLFGEGQEESILRDLAVDSMIQDEPQGRILDLGLRRVDLEVTASDVEFRGESGRQVVIHDLSETKRLIRQADRAERLATLGQMAATLAHEIRNPLGSMALNLQLLADGIPAELRETLTEEFEDLHLGQRRLGNIVDGILDFTRPLDTESLRPFNLLEELNRQAENFRKAHPEVKLELVAPWPHESIWVQGAVWQIGQVMGNLLDNAQAAMPEGGTIRLGIMNEETTVTVTVSDEGKGIETALLERVKEPFFTTKIHGTGLGLAVVSRIAEHMNGTLEFESEMGQGTRASFSVPIAIPPERPHE